MDQVVILTNQPFADIDSDGSIVSEAPACYEPSKEQNDLSYQLVGACIAVHREIGPGFRERIYQNAFAIELGLRGIPFEREKRISVQYKGHDIGVEQIDFFVAGLMVVELKSVDMLIKIHHAQTTSYIKATGTRLGLLINFNVPLLMDGIERVVYGRK